MVLYVLSYFASLASKLLTDLYPTTLASQAQNTAKTEAYLWYLVRICLTAALMFSNGIIFSQSIRNAGIRIFGAAFTNLMRRPISYFEETPIGVIITRFSDDLNYLEKVMPTNLQILMNSMMTILIALILTVIISPLQAALTIISVIYITYILRTSSTVTNRLKVMENEA